MPRRARVATLFALTIPLALSLLGTSAAAAPPHRHRDGQGPRPIITQRTARRLISRAIKQRYALPRSSARVRVSFAPGPPGENEAFHAKIRLVGPVAHTGIVPDSVSGMVKMFKAGLARGTDRAIILNESFATPATP